MPRMIFKNEGEEHGEPFGRVLLLADSAPNSWPHGTTPAGVEDLGWMRISEARAEAARRGLRLDES